MRKQAYNVVYGVLERGKHSDVLFHAVLNNNRNMESRDKRFLKRLSFGTIERAIELDAYINQVASLPVHKMKPAVRTVLRMALYEIYYMDQIPEAVSCHEAVELVRQKDGDSYTAFVNGILRTILRKREKLSLRHPWEILSLPRPLYEHFATNYGKKTAKKIGQAFLEKQAEITLHVDPNKISVEEYVKKLQKAGIIYTSAYYMKNALRVCQVEDVTTLPGYEEGLFYVQDESSMLPVLCAGIVPGDCVLDVCSSPGGKTMHALTCLQGKGIVCARDISEKKIKRVQENVARMQYENIEYHVWNGTKENQEWKEKADVIIADVPCSGIGIIGRKPEIKYEALATADKLVTLQRDIVTTALSQLRRGGVFIYSTCTINRAENEENVAYFEKNCLLKRESLNPYLPEKLWNKMTENGMLQMLPGIHKSDGFFVARFRKK